MNLIDFSTIEADLRTDMIYYGYWEEHYSWHQKVRYSYNFVHQEWEVERLEGEDQNGYYYVNACSLKAAQKLEWVSAETKGRKAHRVSVSSFLHKANITALLIDRDSEEAPAVPITEEMYF